MTKEFDLQNALTALDEYGYNKKGSTSLEQARNTQQMTKYIMSLDFSLRRLQLLQDAVNEVVEQKKHDLIQQERIQTFKTKIINLSREYNMSYEDVLTLMSEQSK